MAKAGVEAKVDAEAKAKTEANAGATAETEAKKTSTDGDDKKHSTKNLKNDKLTNLNVNGETLTAVATVGATHMKSRVEGFTDFVREQGIIGLAVGLAIGTAAGDTVKEIVEGFINPLVQLIIGSEAALSSSVWHVNLFGRTADFAWGAAISSVITLFATALVVYWIIHVLKLDKLDKKKAK